MRPGLLIISTSVLALLLCNFGYSEQYYNIWDQMVRLKIGGFVLEKQLLAIINEGLMALFFLLITIEIRYECLYGFLNNPRYILLPLMGALGGMIVPAFIYLCFNWGTPEANGWAIPVATDIAFSLACLMILGPRFSSRLRIFLLSVAIFDDLGAILIIALYYSDKLSLFMLSIAMGITMVMFLMREIGYQSRTPYYLLSVFLWFFLLKSGIHATLTGSILAMMLPVKKDDGHQLKRLYEDLLPWVKYLILPLFTFANSGVILAHGSASGTLFLGIVLGLVVGKPLGIVSFAYVSNYFKLSYMPQGMTYHHMIGVSFLCGIGYTMSLFIGSLAFSEELGYLLNTVKVSVLFASLMASMLGVIYLYIFCQDKENA